MLWYVTPPYNRRSPSSSRGAKIRDNIYDNIPNDVDLSGRGS